MHVIGAHCWSGGTICLDRVEAPCFWPVDDLFPIPWHIGRKRVASAIHLLRPGWWPSEYVHKHIVVDFDQVHSSNCAKRNHQTFSSFETLKRHMHLCSKPILDRFNTRSDSLILEAIHSVKKITPGIQIELAGFNLDTVSPFKITHRCGASGKKTTNKNS